LSIFEQAREVEDRELKLRELEEEERKAKEEQERVQKEVKITQCGNLLIILRHGFH